MEPQCCCLREWDVVSQVNRCLLKKQITLRHSSNICASALFMMLHFDSGPKLLSSAWHPLPSLSSHESMGADLVNSQKSWVLFTFTWRSLYEPSGSDFCFKGLKKITDFSQCPLKKWSQHHTTRERSYLSTSPYWAVTSSCGPSAGDVESDLKWCFLFVASNIDTG